MEYKIFCEDVARKAGKIMLHYFHGEKNTRIKEDLSPVTVADEEINSMVIEEVKKHFSGQGVLGEEEQFSTSNAEFLWVCDPIDGTIPYTKKIPTAVFSLALVQNGKPIVGVVYDPFLDQLAYAEKEKGAFLNDKLIHVSKKETLVGVTIGFSTWWHTEPDYTPMLKSLIDSKAKLLDIGSAIHMGVLVACGLFEGCFFPAEKPYDGAAVKILIDEAGGIMTDMFGNEQRYDQAIKGYVASNTFLHPQIVSAIKKSFE